MADARPCEVIEVAAELRDGYSCPLVPTIHKHFVPESRAPFVVTCTAGDEDFYGAYGIKLMGPIDPPNIDMKARPGKDEMVYLVTYLSR